MSYLLENDDLAAAIGEALVARGARLAVAESTAGGLISARLLSVAGASRWFERGVVAYSGPSKRDYLGIDVEIIREHGAVSVEAVSASAVGFRAVTGADYAIAESGIAGPQGSRRSPKPVGFVVIAVAGPEKTIVEECTFPGNRAQVMEQIAQRSLEMLTKVLSE
jgi:PncC family amidohydrolase